MKYIVRLKALRLVSRAKDTKGREFSSGSIVCEAGS